MTFENGYTISVQWGTMHYCGNRDLGANVEMGFQPYESKTAEIAATRPNGTYLRLGEGDDVVGWLCTDEVAAYIDTISGPNPEDACYEIPSDIEKPRVRHTTYFAGHSQESTLT